MRPGDEMLVLMKSKVKYLRTSATSGICPRGLQQHMPKRSHKILLNKNLSIHKIIFFQISISQHKNKIFALAEHISRIQLLVLTWAAASSAAARVIPRESSTSTGTRGNTSAG